MPTASEMEQTIKEIREAAAAINAAADRLARQSAGDDKRQNAETAADQRQDGQEPAGHSSCGEFGVHAAAQVTLGDQMGSKVVQERGHGRARAFGDAPGAGNSA